MNQKVVLITGASSGIGMETALLLLSQGYTVYAGARRLASMQKLQAKGGHILPLDVTDEASMIAFVHTAIEKEGRIDILINNAGYGSCGAIEDIPLQEIRSQYEVNVFGLGRMIQLVLPVMRKQNSGKIVNISSMGGRFTSPFGGWYHSTKYAVESISDALRMELLDHSIDVILIEPGMIQTNWGVIAADNIRKYSGSGPYSRAAGQAADYYTTRYHTLTGRLSDPKQVAKTIAKAISVRHPRTRYTVGKYARPFVMLKRLLGDSLFQSLTLSSMGIHPSR